MATSPNDLMALARCIDCNIPAGMQMPVLIALIDTLSDQGGGVGLSNNQIVTSANVDPNAAGIIPDDPTRGAIFYQDPSITLYNEWKWSVITQTWIQTISPT